LPKFFRLDVRNEQNQKKIHEGVSDQDFGKCEFMPIYYDIDIELSIKMPIDKQLVSFVIIKSLLNNSNNRYS